MLCVSQTVALKYRSWEKCFLGGFFWRGGGGGEVGRARPRGVWGKKNLKIFEVFIPENAANASNFKI